MYKVLIVEDDPTIAGIVAEHLGKWGYETKKVSDFEKVMEEFGAFQPHLVLLDIGLPFFQRLSLVRRNSGCFQGAYCVSFLGG